MTAAPGLALAKARSCSWAALAARAAASSLAVPAISCSFFALLASLSFSAISACTADGMAGDWTIHALTTDARLATMPQMSA